MTFLNRNQFSNTNYFTIEETKSKLSCSDDKSFSIRHLNIRSLKKNFDKLVNFLTLRVLILRLPVFLKHGVLMSIVTAISLSYLITVTL